MSEESPEQVNYADWGPWPHNRPAARTCCATPPNEAHAGTCPNSLMRSGRENFFVNQVPWDATPEAEEAKPWECYFCGMKDLAWRSIYPEMCMHCLRADATSMTQRKLPGFFANGYPGKCGPAGPRVWGLPTATFTRTGECGPENRWTRIDITTRVWLTIFALVALFVFCAWLVLS